MAVVGSQPGHAFLLSMIHVENGIKKDSLNDSGVSGL